MHRDRLIKIARSIDELAKKDEALAEHARHVAGLRLSAAAELHRACADFVERLNGLLATTRVNLDPPEFLPEGFRDESPNLLQINVRGRILQIEYRSTEELVSTEEFRIPYTLEGSVRSFNQQLLDQNIIREHGLFYCLQKDRGSWLYFDERTYHSGAFDEDYLAGLLEELL